MFRRFPSVMNPEKYGYIWDDGEWTMNYPVCRHFKQYETYGDGQTQHSRAWPITREFMADYLASLCVFLQANPEEPGDERTFVQEITYDFRDEPSIDAIEFAASVVWKESDQHYDKRRYYSVAERKIGGRAKEHDKRFTEIQDWNDGKPKAIYRMLLPDFAHDLQRYIYASVIKEWVDKQPKMWMEEPTEFLEWKEYQSPQEYNATITRRAYSGILAAIRRYRLSYELNSAADGIKDLVQRSKPKATAVLQIEGQTESAA